MKDLREKIQESPYRTQERFAYECGIAESQMSKYCRGLRELKGKHKEIIEKKLAEKIRY